ncbi:chemotaxis protein CheA [Alkaliflexus imshenetskii]|uniref:chemotaxis protein CheA n=1 Tax=Alkaliflexus imshenetskii TaxID=286730 RepID=UPI0004792705|nr:chemotaxis protein CheA [Alkaliflexus imshenetskii]
MLTSFENFQSKFIEEALDNINDLEQALLELELSPCNKDLLERVFRVMHSLKGGGAMFGFDQLSEFTHRLESIYDLIRSGKLCVSSSLLSVTLKSVDLLRDLLNLDAVDSTEIRSRYKELSLAIEEAMQHEAHKVIASVSSFHQKKSEKPDEHTVGMATYYIHFYPGTHILQNGTNLLYLIDELRALGQMYSIAGVRNLPALEEFSPLDSFFFWDFFLATDQGADAIKDVFIFVEDDSVVEMHKMSNSSLFENSHFMERLNGLADKQNDIGFSDFADFMGSEEVPSEAADSTPEIVSKQDNANGRSSSSIRVSSEKIDGLMNLVSELVITQERLNLIASRYQIPELKMVTERVQKLTGMLRDSAFSISLIPVENMLTRFQRLVRDLSGDLGKQIVFTATGTETEMDKTMIDSLTDPILHIIRNSIDHGIEMPDERLRKGKPAKGTIHLKAGYSGANVVITISDDGAGIDVRKVRQKAIEKEIIKESDLLTEQEILNLVFLPGFSTLGSVTELSGRGVGMDVVKRNIGAIRGEVGITSEVNKGTVITITLPLVLSIIDGLLVRIGQNKYVIPLSLTDRIYPVESHLLENNFIQVMTLDNEQVPFFNLRREMGIGGEAPARCQMVVVNHTNIRMALSVDQVIGKIQAVLKPLGRLYHDQKMVSAATIMGDGTIALVLDVNTFVKQLLN